MARFHPKMSVTDGGPLLNHLHLGVICAIEPLTPHSEDPFWVVRRPFDYWTCLTTGQY